MKNWRFFKSFTGKVESKRARFALALTIYCKRRSPCAPIWKIERRSPCACEKKSGAHSCSAKRPKKWGFRSLAKCVRIIWFLRILTWKITLEIRKARFGLAFLLKKIGSTCWKIWPSLTLLEQIMPLIPLKRKWVSIFEYHIDVNRPSSHYS